MLKNHSLIRDGLGEKILGGKRGVAGFLYFMVYKLMLLGSFFGNTLWGVGYESSVFILFVKRIYFGRGGGLQFGWA